MMLRNDRSSSNRFYITYNFYAEFLEGNARKESVAAPVLRRICLNDVFEFNVGKCLGRPSLLICLGI